MTLSYPAIAVGSVKIGRYVHISKYKTDGLYVRGILRW